MTSLSPCCNPRKPRVGLCALRSYLSPGIQVPDLSRLFTGCSCLRQPQIQQPQGSLSIEPLRRFPTPSTNSFPSTTPLTPPTHREVRPQSHSQDGPILQPFRRQSRLPLRQCPRLPLRFPPVSRQQPIHPSPNPIEDVATNCCASQLAMGVLGALFGGSKLALGGGSKAATQTPPINASSNEEADFIKYFSPRTRRPDSQPLTTLQAIHGPGRGGLQGERQALDCSGRMTRGL